MRTVTDAAGVEWTLTEIATGGQGAMLRDDPRPASTVATLKCISSGQEKVVIDAPVSWRDLPDSFLLDRIARRRKR